jgi:DNA-binding helix-hairpin-helix protein with protein kinase domain
VTAEFSMGDLVNLRTARKRAKRRRAEQAAAANRLAHGRSKSERTLTQAKSDKVRENLDQHRIKTGDGP